MENSNEWENIKKFIEIRLMFNNCLIKTNDPHPIIRSFKTT